MSHFEWKKFYGVGNHLNNYSKEEAYQRSAIGGITTLAMDRLRITMKNHLEKRYPLKMTLIEL